MAGSYGYISPTPMPSSSQMSTPDYKSVGNLNESSCPDNSTEWNFCDEYEDLSQINVVRVIIIIFYAIVMAVGIGGNSMVIAIVVRHRHMRTPTNFYIVSLAASDLFITAFALPLKLVELSADVEKSIHNPILCSMLGFLVPMFVFTSVWTLTAISIDRYLVIVHPLRSRNFNTKSRAIRIISAVWLMPFLILSPYFIPQKVYAYYMYSDYGVIRRELCTEDHARIVSQTFALAYAMLLLLVIYLIPVLVLCFTCGCIALRLLGVTDEQTIIKSSLRKEEAGRRKVAKMVLIVVLCFVICWTPLFVAQVLGNYSTILKEKNFIFILLLINLFALSNSLLNPIVYFLMSQAFRRGFVSILVCVFPCLKGMLIKEKRAVTGVSTSEVPDNSRSEFANSKKRERAGQGMSWRETTQYSAISEPPEEIDLNKIKSRSTGTGNADSKRQNGKNLTKIDEVGGESEPDTRTDEEEHLMSTDLNSTKNKNDEYQVENNFTDVELNSENGNTQTAIVNDAFSAKCDSKFNNCSPGHIGNSC